MRLPEPNERVAVILRDGRLLGSRVEDVREPDVVAIGIPVDAEGNGVSLAGGERLALEWTCLRGLAHGTGIVAARENLGVPVLLVRLDASGIAQRREHVRAELTVPFDLRRRDGAPIRGLTMDISGGGMRARVPLALEPGDGAQVQIHLPDEAPVTAAAEVIRGSEEGGYAFRFFAIEAAEHERLIRFVFAAHTRAFASVRRAG